MDNGNKWSQFSLTKIGMIAASEKVDLILTQNPRLEGQRL
jgi:hypothetical protein